MNPLCYFTVTKNTFSKAFQRGIKKPCTVLHFDFGFLLHEAFGKAIERSNFKFNQSERQDGNGSNLASPNLALCVLEKWCLSHKLDLVLEDAFKGTLMQI